MSDPKTFITKTEGSGQSVTLNLGNGFRQAALAIGLLVIALVVCGALTLRAYDKASDAEYESARYAMWAQTLEARLIANGFNPPPLPERKRN